jgi:ion channel-forming bestrophin family protein
LFVHRNIPWSLILRFAWKNLLIFIGWSTFWVLLHHYLHECGIEVMIPYAPVSTIGIAVSFYLSLKNNQSYDRFWEARTIWGGIVNASRTFANQVLTYLPANGAKHSAQEVKAIQKRLIYRHLAYINALRLHLRKPTTFSPNYEGAVKKVHFGSTERSDFDMQVKPFLGEAEYEELTHYQNMPAHILRRQSDDLQAIFEQENLIENFRHLEMMGTIRDFYSEQGRCERIKNTPFPRQYAYFSKVFVWIFVLLVPLALSTEFEKMGDQYLWLVVPFSTLISWIFITIEIVGDNSEDPFENFINDVPMTALCRTIEIDLREMLGETDLPPRILPQDGILL